MIKIKIILFNIIFAIIGLTGCVSYGTTFSPNENSSLYNKKTPCEPQMVIKIDPNEMKNYELIGTCKSTMPSGGLNGINNNAIKEIKKCACNHGGDLIKLIESHEASGVSGGLVDQYNPNSTRMVYHDKIEAEIFRKKN